MSDLQPEKHDSPESVPSKNIPATTESVVPAPAPLPPPETAAPGEEGKDQAGAQVAEPSKLPAKRSTDASRLRAVTMNTGPSGVTRTRTTKATVRSTPISREGRVTRSSTAKSRQAEVLKEKEKGSTNLVTQSRRDGEETGKVEKEKDGKDNANPGINI